MATRTSRSNILGLEVDRRDVAAINRMFRVLIKDAPEKFKGAASRAAEIFAGEARRRVPVRSGRLRGDIRTGATGGTPYIAVGRQAVPYAFPIEFGWLSRGIEAQSFIYSSIDDKGKEALGEYEKAVDEILGVA